MYRLIGTIAVCAASTIAFAQTPEGKKAEEAYKNIVQMKGVPADQVQPAMQFIATSLGVNCQFCHVQGDPSSDEKGAKKTARMMMEMTAKINQEAFRGRQTITCESCHRGSTRPVSMPPVMETDTPPAAMAMGPGPGGPAAGRGPAANQGPTADQIVEKYIAAVGGADAIHKISTRQAKGETVVADRKSPIELYTKAPNMRVSISKMGNGDSYTAFDGTTGWMGNNGREAPDMSPEESWAAGLDAELALPLRLKEIFPQLRRGRPETINGEECEVLTGMAQGHAPVRFDFSTKTNLLLRLVRYTDTPMGRTPTQIDYADYRDADGVKIPFRWTISRPNGRFTIQLSDVKSNVPIDAAKFAKPSGPIN